MAGSPNHARRHRVAVAWRTLQLKMPTALVGCAVVAALLTVVPLTLTARWLDERDARIDGARYGSTIARRLAASAVEPLIADDRLALSLLAREYTALPALATAAVYGADGRRLAAADAGASSPPQLDAPGTTVFLVPISLQGSTVGHARVAIDATAFRTAGPTLLPAVAVASTLVVVALAAWLGAAFGGLLRRLRGHAEQLTGHPAAARDDLTALIDLLDPPREEEEATTAAAAATATPPRFLLVLNLFHLAALEPTARATLTRRCEAILDGICQRYGGRHERVPGTGLVAFLAPEGDDAPAARAAIRTALVTRQALTHAESADDEGASASLVPRLGLHPIDATERPASPGEALLQTVPQSLTRAVTLSAIARDRGLVVSDAVVTACGDETGARLERVESTALRAVTGEATAWAVEDVVEDERSAIAAEAETVLEEAGAAPPA